jgi:hypothetical protein
MNTLEIAMNRSCFMHLVKSPKRAAARFILGFGIVAAGSAAAQDCHRRIFADCRADLSGPVNESYRTA